LAVTAPSALLEPIPVVLGHRGITGELMERLRVVSLVGHALPAVQARQFPLHLAVAQPAPFLELS